MIRTQIQMIHLITAIRTGSTEGAGTAGTLGEALTGIMVL